MEDYSGVRRCSTFDRMQHSFWTTREAITKKFGKVEDNCIVASDANLDAKLELLNTTIKLLDDLLKVLETYQRSLKKLWKHEAAFGTFLNESGASDATDAGHVLRRVGGHIRSIIKTQKHLTEDLPHLHEDVDTFTRIAFQDVSLSVEKMECARISYRGSLMWMKHATRELDPDQPKTMKKFRKIQGKVKSAKVEFERLKLETMEKIDMLMASKNHLLAKFILCYHPSLISSFRIAYRKSKHLLSLLEKGYSRCIIFKRHKDDVAKIPNMSLRQKSADTNVFSESLSNKTFYKEKNGDGDCKHKNEDLKKKADSKARRKRHEPTDAAVADISHTGNDISLISFEDTHEDGSLDPSSKPNLSPRRQRKFLSKKKDKGVSIDNFCSHGTARDSAYSLPSKSLKDHSELPPAHQLSEDINISYRFLPSQLLNDDDDSSMEDAPFQANNGSAETKDLWTYLHEKDESNTPMKDHWNEFLINWDPLYAVDNDPDGKC